MRQYVRGKTPWLHISYRTGISLYAAQRSNGLIKVGRSSNPRARMERLSVYVRANYASANITRIFVAPARRGVTDNRTAEKHLLKRVRRVANQRPESTEIFSDISFEVASQMCAQVSRIEFAGAR